MAEQPEYPRQPEHWRQLEHPSWAEGFRSGQLVRSERVPEWLRPLVESGDELDAGLLRRLAVDGPNARDAAVLVLFGESAGRGHVLLQLRADTPGAHAGQVSFPGGGAEPDDHGPVETALREAREEVGLPESTVRPIALLPRLHVPVSGYNVTPVIAHSDTEASVGVVDPGETQAVARIPLDWLTDPANRVNVRVREAYSSPAFLVPGMLVWGFTGMVLTGLLRLGGWDRGSDPDGARELELDEAWRIVRSMPPLPGKVQT